MKITQISSFIENRPGRLHAACAALAAQGVQRHTGEERIYPGTCRPENGGLRGRRARAWRACCCG